MQGLLGDHMLELLIDEEHTHLEVSFSSVTTAGLANVLPLMPQLTHLSMFKYASLDLSLNKSEMSAIMTAHTTADVVISYLWLPCHPQSIKQLGVFLHAMNTPSLPAVWRWTGSCWWHSVAPAQSWRPFDLVASWMAGAKPSSKP